MEEPSRNHRIEAMQQGHLGSLARAHVKCFPGFFLANLGASFLETYYENYLSSGYGFGALALDGSGEVVAFAVGVTHLDGQDSALLRRNLWKVARAIASQWFVNPALRRQVFERVGRLSRVFRRTVTKDIPAAEVSREALPYVVLTSLGVDPEHRGSGLAEAVMAKFEELALARGYAFMRAATSIDNHRAVAFYGKNGWVVESYQTASNGVTFEKEIKSLPAAERGD